MSESSETPVSNNDRKHRIYEKAGIVLVTVAAFILGLTFWPAMKEEIRYFFSEKKNAVPIVIKSEKAAERPEHTGAAVAEDVIYPVDEDFGIVIPKIDANAKVIADVDWQDSAVYQRALTRGVAHARGTAYPGETGNIFLFAHSGVDFYEAARYNAVFYLINKLDPGDEITLLYQKRKFTYRVTERKMVAAEDVRYLTGDQTQKTLTLMTCWPPGTTVKRVVVIAEQTE